MAPLDFDTTLSGAGDALIALTGELDLAGASALEQEIEQLAARDGVERVILDLRGLEFMDSSGLRVVALAERLLEGRGGSLVLVRGNENVQRVFEITRMVDRLRFVDDPGLNGSGT